MFKDQFAAVLAEFGSLFDEKLELDDDSSTVITVDEDIIINIRYLDASDTVLIFSTVGGFGDMNDPVAGKMALALLQLNDISNKSVGQFTLMLDSHENAVIAADRLSAVTLTSKDAFAAWINALVVAVRATRDYFAKHFPLTEQEES